MYKHILIATDGSALAEKAVALGLDLAKFLGAKVTIVTVTEPPGFATTPTPAFLDAYEKAATENASRILASASEVAKKKGVTCVTLHVKDHYPAEGIKSTGKDQGCDLIVMASHGRHGLERLLLGSETIKVLTHSTVPVLVCR
jgi:nucleotide-binding universal stress UspA family protein